MADSLKTAFPSLAAKWDELTPKLADLESRFVIDDENRVQEALFASAMAWQWCGEWMMLTNRAVCDARWCGVRVAMCVRDR
jgi:hypothetical protein